MKKSIMFGMILCFCLGFLLLSPTIAAGENLAVNGNLEMGNTNGWDIDYAAIDSSVVHNGSYSLKLNATVAYQGAAYKMIPVRTNATITVSFYYRYSSTPSSDRLYHVFTYQGKDTSAGPYSSADRPLPDPSGCNSSISTWRNVSYTFNSGNYSAIYLKFCPNGNGGTACYIDDLVVTMEGGDETDIAPYLTSFGTKYNRPANAAANGIAQGGFESASGASWNTDTFLGQGLSVVTDDTAREGNQCLFLDASATTVPRWHTFPVTVEPYTSYTFSAWVKSPRLSKDNRATATFGIVDAATGEFLVFEPYNGNGMGVASLSTPTMQLMATAPDDQWHLRSVTFHSGSAKEVHIAVYGAQSQLYLDDMALFKSASGIEYISPLRTATITASTNSGYRYCADEHSLFPSPHMSGRAAQDYWADNPAWRNGFLFFREVADDHGMVLQYAASAHTERALWYIDWVDVQPNTDYTLTLDVKRLSAGGGRIVLLDDNILNPEEFYSISFSQTDNDWQTYSITFNSGVYSRIGFAIVDGGGVAYIDKTRLFRTADGIAQEPVDTETPRLKPMGGATAAMEISVAPNHMLNGDFEQPSLSDYLVYQGSVLSADAAYSGNYGVHLRGDGSWGALLEQYPIPVEWGHTYTFSFRYKANSNGTNVTLKGMDSDHQYAYAWTNNTQWTEVSTTFTVGEDTSLLLNICGGGNGIEEDVYLDDLHLMDHDGARGGVAFLMELSAAGVQQTETGVAYLTHATVDVYGDGTRYPLKRMGALLTNKSVIGTNRTVFKLDVLSHSVASVADAPAVYLWSLERDAVSYAVRVVDVPLSCADTMIYARPYYVFDKDGEEIVVYGDIYSRSYADAYGSGSFYP